MLPPRGRTRPARPMRCPRSAVPRQPLGDDDPGSRLDQGEVRERLREVAEVAAGVSVELLRVEPERRGDPEQALHQVAGALLLADDRQRRDQPEGADQEAALLAREPVVRLAGPIAQYEPVLGQVICDRQNALVETLIVTRQEAEEGRQQG